MRISRMTTSLMINLFDKEEADHQHDEYPDGEELDVHDEEIKDLQHF